MGESQTTRLNAVLNWVPAALAVVMIACESTPTMSAANTSHWLYPVWVRIFGPISAASWEQVNHYIRKAGHFIGYGVVSVAFFYGLVRTLRVSKERAALWFRASEWAILCTFLIASLDEFHQSFLPSRTSSPLDVAIDVCGAITAQALLNGIGLLFLRRGA